MTLTVVTDRQGKIIATMQGSVSAPRARSGVYATLSPAPGQIFREIQVPAGYARLTPQALHDQVARQLRRRPRAR